MVVEVDFFSMFLDLFLSFFLKHRFRSRVDLQKLVGVPYSSFLGTSISRERILSVSSLQFSVYILQLLF